VEREKANRLPSPFCSDKWEKVAEGRMRALDSATEIKLGTNIL
jgi:hypothetical protein